MFTSVYLGIQFYFPVFIIQTLKYIAHIPGECSLATLNKASLTLNAWGSFSPLCPHQSSSESCSTICSLPLTFHLQSVTKVSEPCLSFSMSVSSSSPLLIVHAQPFSSLLHPISTKFSHSHSFHDFHFILSSTSSTITSQNSHLYRAGQKLFVSGASKNQTTALTESSPTHSGSPRPSLRIGSWGSFPPTFPSPYPSSSSLIFPTHSCSGMHPQPWPHLCT